MSFDTKKVRDYCEQATHGPWSWERGLSGETEVRYQHVLAVGGENPDVGKGICDTFHDEGGYGLQEHPGRKEDAEFIAQARTDLPAACDEIDRLRKSEAAIRADERVKVLEDARPAWNNPEYHKLFEQAIQLADAVKAYRCATTNIMPSPPSREDRSREAFSKMMVALVPFEDCAKELPK